MTDSEEQRTRVVLEHHVPDVPPRDHEKWGVAYWAHRATGFIAAAGMMTIPTFTGNIALVVPFGLLTFVVCVRQTVEFMRRRDTPGRDLEDHIYGFIAGLALGLILVGSSGRFLW